MVLHFFRWPSTPSPHSNESRSPLTLVFLHGMGGTGQIWRPIAAHLEDDFNCLAPDQRGHGQSRPIPSGEENQFHAEDYARDIKELLDQEGINQTILIGHSMGVRTAMALARLDPVRTQGLIAVDIGISSSWGGGIGEPLAHFIQKLPKTFANRTLMREHLFANCPDPAIAQYLSAVAKKTREEPETWEFPFNHEALISTIEQADQAPLEKWLFEILNQNIPCIFLRGENSKVWLKPDYEEQTSRLKHPNLKFEEWENCGHGLPFEHRSRFIDFIRKTVYNWS